MVSFWKDFIFFDDKIRQINNSNKIKHKQTFIDLFSKRNLVILVSFLDSKLRIFLGFIKFFE